MLVHLKMVQCSDLWEGSYGSAVTIGKEVMGVLCREEYVTVSQSARLPETVEHNS
jgi:hypothetical protein